MLLLGEYHARCACNGGWCPTVIVRVDMIRPMQYPLIRRLELHLLYYLAVLLAERHVTRAAARCALSQSAMSRQLERLRDVLGDELLLRNGRIHERTARGERLLRELEPLLPRIEAVLQGRSFDPAISEDRFQTAMTDYAAVVLLPEIVRRVRNSAPNTRLDVLPWSAGCFDDLHAGRLDTVITVAGIASQPAFRSETLFTDEFVCVVSRRHPLNRQRVSLGEYLKFRHLVVAVIAGQQTLVDRPLSDLSIKREVALTLPFFAPAITAVAESDLILTIPSRLAKRLARVAPIRTMTAPAEIKSFHYDMIWHPRLDDDPAHSWFRDQVRRVGKVMMQIGPKRPHRSRKGSRR